ncbi:MAG: GGDEF domain-containing protein [Deltaproteobacteria bacterium]|nr:GGDEF domain-containing protein [Deltaproteobacteria bacterium]
MAPEREDKTQIKDIKDLIPDAKKSQAYFIVISGKRVGSMYKVSKDEMIIGRVPESDILIEDDGVSRRHAKIERAPNGSVRIVDLESTNGTFFNGARIDQHVLRDGDKIQIGSTTILKFSYQDTLEEQFQRQLFESATKDPLTRINNRKTFAERYASEFAYALRHRKFCSLIIFDIDHFKKVNDTYGHQAGDFVLRQLAQVVSDMIRSEDLLARYGGEEFVILARDIDEEKAFIFAMRIRRAVEKHEFKFQGQVIPVTVSLGVATLSNANYHDHEEMFRAADEFLYKAKNNGRNRVESALTH